MIKLMEHQNTILAELSENDSFAILAEQGTGKTLPVLKHMAFLCRYGMASADKILVIAPLSACGAWRDSMELLTAEERELLKDIVIINYDKISRTNNPMREELWHEWDMLVLDEAHAIANTSSNRTKYLIGYKGRGKKGYVAGLNSLAKRRYILSGTLVTNGRLEDLYAPLTFLNPAQFGSYNDFKNTYLSTFRPPMAHYEIVTGYRNIDQLEAILGEVGFRVLKSDCMDLPEKFDDTLIRVPMKCGPIYKQAKQHYIDNGDIEVVMDNPLVTSMKLRQLCSGFVYDNDRVRHTVPCDKPRYLRELVEGIVPNKVVIFCEFTHSIDEVSEVLSSMGVKHLIQDGRTKDKDTWRQFNANDDIKAIILQYKSGSAGINLQSATHTVFYEPPLSTTDLAQAKDRTHRMGVKSGCNYYFLITEKSIEEQIYDRLKSGMDFTAEFFASTFDLPYE